MYKFCLAERIKCVPVSIFIKLKKYQIPGDANLNGFCVKSGQSTTETETLEKFFFNPSSKTVN